MSMIIEDKGDSIGVSNIYL